MGRETEAIEHGALAEAVRQAADAIVITDPDGVIQFANPAFTAMTGYSCEEAVGQTPRVLKSGQHSQAFYENLWGTIRSGRVWQGEIINQRKDGAKYVEEMRIAPIKGPQEEIKGYVAIKRDVTERKALDEAQRFLATIVEGSQDAILSYSPAGTILTWNRGAEAIFGYASGEAVGHHVSFLIPPERHPFVGPILEKLLSAEAVPLRKGVALHKDGRRIHVSIRSSPIRDSSGEVIAISDMVRDESIRHEVEDTRALLAAIVESSADAISSVDLDGTILSWNRACELMYGYSRKEAIGRNITEFAPITERAKVKENLEKVRHGVPISPFEALIEREDGALTHVSTRVSVIRNAAGEVVGSSASMTDITDRIEKERALEAAEKKYKDIFEGALEGIFQIEPGGRPLAVNPALARILGYDSPEDFVSSVRDVTNSVWVNLELRARILQQIEEQGIARNVECLLRRKDSSVIWVALNGRKVEGIDGREPFIEGFIEDITERRRADKELRDSESRLREAEILAQSGNSTWDVYSDRTTWSEGLFRIFGKDPDSPAPNHSQRAKIYTAESWARLNEAVKNTLATGEPYDLEVQIVRQDGSLRWTHARGAAVCNDLGRVHRLVGTLQDITDQKLAAEALRESQERLELFIEHAPASLAMFDVNLAYICASRRWCTDCGLSYEDVEGKLHHDAFLELPAKWKEAHRRGLAGEVIREEADRFERADGSVHWIRWELRPWFGASGRVGGILIFSEDITEQRNAAVKLLESEERYRIAFETSLDGIAISRLSDGKHIDVNQAMLDLMGYAREEFLGRTALELGLWANPRDRIGWVNLLHEKSSFQDMRVNLKKKNGDIFWGLMSSSLMQIDGEACVLAVVRDISASKAAEEEIRNLAFYDHLTGLPNRRLLSDRLRHAAEAASRSNRIGALLFIDLDNLKILNDTLGHQAGDLLLEEVAKRLSASVRIADTVARFAGDEFVVILENLSENVEDAATHAHLIAEKILEAQQIPYLIEGREWLSGSSIGITTFGNQTLSTDDLMQQADIAMYQAKRAGRNTVRFFAPPLQFAINARVDLEEDLRQAVKTGQFVLYYQPQITNGKIDGVEALIRWKHPVRGVAMPDSFIPVAEETGQILQIGTWVLETACAQIAAWANRKETSQLTIAVNISAREFRQPQFVENVLSVLDRSGANPRSLRLELTEGTLVHNLEEVIAKMTILRSHGVRFSLDDFGTGYSSLLYLKRLPLDRLKIDRAFIRDMLIDITSGAIVRAVIALSKAMDLSVIAEGVENEQQREALASLGCKSFQGYLFSPPVPLEEFELRLGGLSAASGQAGN